MEYLTVNALCFSVTRDNSNTTSRQALVSPPPPSLMGRHWPSEGQEFLLMESSQGDPHYSLQVLGGLTHSHGWKTVVPVMDARWESITQKGSRFEVEHLKLPSPSSLDASALLEALILIDCHMVTGSRFMRLEMLQRGYLKMASYMMGESGRLMMRAIMIFMNSVSGGRQLSKRESNYLA
jgi:hypothetical protein